MKYVTQGSQISEITTTSDSLVDVFTLNTPVVSGRSYMLYLSAEMGSISTVGPIVEWANDAGTRLFAFYRGLQDTTDWIAQGGFYIYDADATETHAFKIRWRRSNATGSPTVKIRNVRALVVELEAGVDFWDGTNADLGTSSTSYQSAASVTFNPPSTRDYLVMASGYIYNSRAAVALLLSDGTTRVCAQSDLSFKNLSGGDFYNPMWAGSLSTGVKTFVLQAKSISGAILIGTPCIVALDLSVMHDYFTTQDYTDNTGTNTSYTTVETLTATGMDTSAYETIVFGHMAVYCGSAFTSSGGRFTEGGSSRIEIFVEGTSSSARLNNMGVGFKSAAAGSSITYNWDRIAESATGATTIKSAVIVVLLLPPASTPVELTVSGGGRMDGEGAAPSVLAGSGMLLSPASGAVLEGAGFEPTVLAGQAVSASVAGAGGLVGTGHEVTVVAVQSVLLTLAAAGEMEGIGAAPDVLAGQAVFETVAAAAEFIGTGQITSFSAGIELAIAAAAQFVGGGAVPSVSVGVQVEAGSGQGVWTGATPSVAAGQAVLLQVAEGGRLEALGYAPGTVVGILLVTGPAAFTGEGFEPSISVASGVTLEIGAGAEFEGVGAAPNVLAGEGVHETVGGAEFEGTGAAPDVLAGSGSLETIAGAAAFEGAGGEPFFVFGFATSIGDAASFIGRGFRVTFGPVQPEEYMTTVTGTFTGSGVSATLRLRNQVESVFYTFTSPGTGTVSLERALTPDATAWEVVAGPFRAAASGSVVARPNDRYRVQLRNHSTNVDYTINDEDAIVREDRNAENEMAVQLKESGVVVSGTVTEV